MKIALIGYGKMGKAIEQIAIDRGHEISLKITSCEANFDSDKLKGTDVAIEFSIPEAAEKNMKKCFEAGVPVVVGTTGWYDKFEEITEECNKSGNTLFHATNFSVGVNIFFEINKRLATLMNSYSDYQVDMTEIHHTQKLDEPSGTAISLADQIIDNLERKHAWKLGTGGMSVEIPIKAEREGEVPGTHIINYESPIDVISIKHEAKNRKGFALGAVLAAEFSAGKKGVLTMQDLLNL